jgi:hypothetical protein
MIGIPYWQGALALAAIIVVVLVALERMTSWRREVGVDVDGDLGPSHRRHGAGPRAAAAAE